MLQLVRSFRSGAASFPGFAWPKTTLQLGTERGLTSEFGMGSGGTRTLWPAYSTYEVSLSFINFSLFAWGRSFLAFLRE